jgi:bacterioferritin
MGKRGLEILKVDTTELIKQLNAALSEEWLAYYQYWIGARVMEGPLRTDVEQELLLHATQELNHAVMVVDRIIQIGGTPVLSPSEWFNHAGCDYLKPEDPYIEEILKQNLEGERCAIDRYQSIIDLTYGKDHTTYNMALTILNEELEHEQDIEDWLNDIEIMRKNLEKMRV